MIRIARSSARLAFSASGPIAGRKPVKHRPSLVRPRARKAYPRKVNEVCSCVARRRPLRHGRETRPRRGVGPDPRQLGQPQPSPPGPRRQPPDQRRDPPHRRHPRPLPPRTRDYLARKRAEGKTRPRGHALPQTPPRPPHLAAPAYAPPGRRNTAITIAFLT